MTIRVVRLFSALALLAAAVAAPLAAQDRGSIEGRVLDQATQQPLAGVQVTIVGTNRMAITGVDGRFRFDNVPAGNVQVRVRHLGFALATSAVTVTAGQAATVDIALTASPIGLDVVVVTPTGEARTREIANSVSTIQGDAITNKVAPRGVGDLMQARAPGLTIQQSGGTTGSGTRVRIRGSNSVSLSNEPVIVVDGIRVNNDPNASSIGVGGQQTSRLDDINPDDIESIEVIKGPAAAALYGTAAANGVIQIRTKKGAAGPARWNFYYGNTGFSDVTDYPGNYRGLDSLTTCSLRSTGTGGTCVQDSIRISNPIETHSPFRRGTRNEYGGNVSGGREGLTYYLSGEMEDESGIYRINDGRKYNLRASLRALLNAKAEVTASTGYAASNVRLPENDNNSFGVLPSGLLGRTDTINGGYGFLTPEQSMSIETNQIVDRFDARINLTWKPISWVDLTGTVGTDITARLDERTTYPGEIPAAFSITAFEGSRIANRVNNYNISANFLGKATRDLTAALRSTTSVGVQYFRDYGQGVFAQGRKLVAGNNSLGGIVIPSVNETTNETILIGGFIEEVVGINDRLFLTAALRGDRSSAFGRRLENFAVYPKFGGSWVVSEESFFPDNGAVSSLRLRASFGEALLQPGTTASRVFYNPTAVSVNNVDVPGITIGSLGNQDLKPERTREIELGFDADIGRNLGRFEFTYYDKRSRDALVARRLAPSLGGPTTRFENLGEVSNKGVELMLSVTPVNMDNVRLDLTASAWGNKNRLIELGEGIEPIIFGLGGASQRHQEGYPLGGFWGQPVSFNDANGDGVIQTAEVIQDPTTQFLGSVFPTHGGGLSATVTLMKRFTIFANLDGRFGHKLFNSTEEFRCGFGICRGLHDPTSSLWDQARSIAAGPLANDAGFMEDAGFVKLRELSFSYELPERWTSAFGGRSAAITIVGRNLKTWTDYTGFDPEINGGGQANFNTFEFLSQPPVRFWSVRVTLGL
jgi:TonB-linked SusC/RagA family outer membrane protein